MPMKKGGKKFQWSEEQILVVREQYKTKGPDQLSKEMGIPYWSVLHLGKKLGLHFDDTPWTQEIIEILKSRYQSDGPVKLAKELGVPYWALVAKSRRLGIGITRKAPPKNFSWTEENLSQIKDRYIEEGGDVLAKDLGVAIDTVRHKAGELGLHTNVGHIRWGKERSETRASLDIHYFDEWTPNMAYILGFMFADGCIDSKLAGMTVRISAKDRSVLDFIKTETKSERKIYYMDKYEDKRGSVYQPQVIIILSSTVLVKQLMKLGLKPRKTYNNDPFPDVPDKVMPDFVRGYLDGDGTTSISSRDVCTVGFVGSPRFIVGLQDSLMRLAGMSKVAVQYCGEATPYATVSWCGIADIRKFYGFAYPKGFEFCLERKKANLDKWLSKPRCPRGFFSGNRFTGPLDPAQSKGPWSDEEEKAVHLNYHWLGPTKLAELLGRSLDALNSKAKRLGVI